MMLGADTLGALPGVRHGFFTRAGGVSEGPFASLNCGFGSGDEAARVAENRNLAMARLALSAEALCTAFQHHGTKCVEVTAPWRHANRPQADVLLTDRPDVALGVLTADCAPVLLADRRAGNGPIRKNNEVVEHVRDGGVGDGPIEMRPPEVLRGLQRTVGIGAGGVKGQHPYRLVRHPAAHRHERELGVGELVEHTGQVAAVVLQEGIPGADPLQLVRHGRVRRHDLAIAARDARQRAVHEAVGSRDFQNVIARDVVGVVHLQQLVAPGQARHQPERQEGGAPTGAPPGGI